MATIKFFTGFEGCEGIADFRTFFDSEDNVEFYSSGGINDSKCVGISSWNFHFIKNISLEKTVVVGYNWSGGGDNDYSTDLHRHMMRIELDDGTFLRVFYSHGNNELYFYRNDIKLATIDLTISEEFHHFEAKFFSDSSTGTFQFKLDGELVADESELNTGGGDIIKVAIGSMMSGTAKKLDNFFIADDWIGALKIQLLQPTSDDSVQFTPSSGSDNYEMFQENDGDDNYVYSDTVDHKDLYEYGPGITDNQYVKGVLVHQIARKDDTDARNLQTIMEVENTEHNLDEYVLSDDYPSGYKSAQYEVLGKAPDGTDWTYEKVNSMKVGFKVSA